MLTSAHDFEANDGDNAELFAGYSYAANAFLDASNDQPISAKFSGTEWSDDIGEKDISLTLVLEVTAGDPGHFKKIVWKRASV